MENFIPGGSVYTLFSHDRTELKIFWMFKNAIYSFESTEIKASKKKSSQIDTLAASKNKTWTKKEIKWITLQFIGSGIDSLKKWCC